MSLTITRSAVAPVRYSTARPPSLFARLLAAIAREVRLRRDLRVLASLDDAGLHDIGLSRGALEYAVRHGRWPGHVATSDGCSERAAGRGGSRPSVPSEGNAGPATLSRPAGSVRRTPM